MENSLVEIVELKGGFLPTRGTDDSAGMDLHSSSNEVIIIPPHENVMIGTGIKVKVPDGYFGGIYPRSGMSAKRSLRPANCVGVIDSDYTGEVMVALHNDSNAWQRVEPHERIAQLIIQPYLKFNWERVESLENTERGEGGFGSTGTN